MESELFIIIGVFVGVIFALLFIGNYAERRYYRKHPPDDGTREEHFDDE